MNIVVHTSRGGKPRSIHLGTWLHTGIFLTGFIALISVMVGIGYVVGSYKSPDDYVLQWSDDLSNKRSELEELRSQAQADLHAMSAKLGQMQGHITRLDALGSRLVAMADIDSNEFSFVNPPALGGPEDVLPHEDVTLDSIESAFQALDTELQHRESQLLVLEEAITTHKLNEEVYPQGRPIKKGWLSSYYGWRNDPFGGSRQFHKGVDFAGKEDSDILAVAGGVVTWSGRRYGYGNLVEITHGNGYVTRYGHNKLNLVKEGEAVKKGQVLAKMGSTGRSTGPHVHFEVIKNGQKINPLEFINN